MRALVWLAVAVGTAGGGGIPSGAPRLHAVPSTTQVTVGELFRVAVQAQAPPGTRWSFPAHLATEQVTLRATEVKDPTAVAVYEAMVFTLDTATIPAISAAYQLPDGTSGEVATPPVVIPVASLLPDDPQDQKLADLRPPVPLPAGAPFWMTLGAVVLGLAGAVAWGWRRRRRGLSTSPHLPPLPPAEEARAALRHLEEVGLLQRGDLRAFYIQLTAIAKRYLKRSLEAPVLEMTSAETFAFLRDHPTGRRVAAVVRDLTTTADWVKFAAGAGEEAQARRHWQQVWGLIEELESVSTGPTGGPLERTV